MYALQSKRYHKRIAPLIFKPCNVDRLSWTLSGFQLIDFRKDFDGAASASDLLALWSMRYRVK